jgi:hypothetical protein
MQALVALNGLADLGQLSTLEFTIPDENPSDPRGNGWNKGNYEEKLPSEGELAVGTGTSYRSRLHGWQAHGRNLGCGSE